MKLLVDKMPEKNRSVLVSLCIALETKFTHSVKIFVD